MKTDARLMIMLGLIALLAGGCSRPILKQEIPVTTNPLGAKIYANGQYMGTTPNTVSLERTRNHILTLIKENYRQEDVVIERQYQKERVYLQAIQSGVNSGLFFKNPAMGINSGMGSISSQEETGEAFILAPPAVKVSLTPLAGSSRGDPVPAPSARSGAPTGASRPEGAAEAPPLDRGELSREVLKIGAGAALTQIGPVGKTVETSSSSKRYVTPDGTRVREKSSTSVGASFNPAGLVDVIDTLFK
ncbi:MAG: PEGA domain-containing protein [Syntrophales bacterium]